MSTKNDPSLEYELLKAGEYLGAATKQLEEAGLESCIKHVDVAYSFVEPFLIWGRHLNAVHHTTKVLELLVEIMIGQMEMSSQLSTTPDQLPIAIWAALFHDAGNAFDPKDEKKISVDKVRDEPSLREPAIAQRKRHMQNGAPLVECIMSALRDRLAFKDQDISAVRELVRHHDDPTLGEYLKESPDLGKYLFVPDADLSRPLFPMSAFLREADRLWMLTIPGIIEDLKRKPKDPVKQIEGNTKRHCEEKDLYEICAKTVAPDQSQQCMKEWGFQTDTAFYRSEVGKKKFALLPIEAGKLSKESWDMKIARAGGTPL